MLFPVVIHKDKDSSYGVTIPDIPGCFTGGDTLEEAVANVQEAVAAHLEGEARIPAPSAIETHRPNPDYAGGTWMMVDIDTTGPGKAKRINITMPERILRDVDAKARKLGLSRSAFLARAAVQALGRERRAG